MPEPLAALCQETWPASSQTSWTDKNMEAVSPPDWLGWSPADVGVAKLSPATDDPEVLTGRVSTKKAFL
jgi:hypothetical protein